MGESLTREPGLLELEEVFFGLPVYENNPSSQSAVHVLVACKTVCMRNWTGNAIK